MSWLLGTLMWTGFLITAVLMVRRPVARHFGPTAAYALWFIPILRLALPPIVLPAWLGPARASPVASDMTFVSLPAKTALATAPVSSIDWSALVVAVWLIGAAVYAVARLASYFRLRRELLENARTVGMAGGVRLVETQATASPLAFGVVDKVVALPPGFMASPDRRARDLALAHELAHHRAHDLAFNFLALPLFALHWFNPLSLLGWRAMRRDQEAACDARVVVHCDRLERATYAALIASTVAGPRGALAAPMACPVLGDKSIVHRLRNLTMTTHSQRRRRAGALLIGAGVLLVPMTASISYAQDEIVEAPPPPVAPTAPIVSDAPLALIAPTAPLPPEAPLPPQVGEGRYVIEASDLSPRHPQVMIVRRENGPNDGKHGHPMVRRDYRVIEVDRHAKFDEKAFEKRMEALDERLSHLGEDLEGKMPSTEEIARITAHARHSARIAMAVAPGGAIVAMNCDGADDVNETTTADGTRVIRICRQRMAGPALGSLRAARAQITGATEMSPEVREQVLEKLDREIERLEKTK
jgi:bla regulator protein BlaR1